MVQFRYNLSIPDDQFEMLTPVEQDIIRRLSAEHPGRQVPAQKPVKFTMLETPESASKRMEETNDRGEGFDVTEFSTIPKPRRLRT